MSYTNISLGQKVEALSIKLSDLQREVAGLRRDVRTILHLLREQNRLQTELPKESVDELEADSDNDLLD